MSLRNGMLIVRGISDSRKHAQTETSHALLFSMCPVPKPHNTDKYAVVAGTLPNELP